MAFLSGRPSSSSGSMSGHSALIPTAAMSLGSIVAAASIELVISLKSLHYTLAASCSYQPGLGLSTSCWRDWCAMILPLKSTITPLDLDVPISIPIRHFPAISLLHRDCSMPTNVIHRLGTTWSC